jgi:hypothetical protein
MFHRTGCDDCDVCGEQVKPDSQKVPTDASVALMEISRLLSISFAVEQQPLHQAREEQSIKPLQVALTPRFTRTSTD